MTYKLIFLFTLVAIFFFLWLVLILKSKERRIGIAYSLFVLNMALWTLGLALFYFCSSRFWFVFWAKELYFTGGLIPASFLLFSFVFPEPKTQVKWQKLALIFFPNIILFFLFFFTPIIIQDVIIKDSIREFVYGSGLGHILFDLPVYIAFIWAFVRFWKAYKNNSGVTKFKIKYILLGTLFWIVPTIFTNVILLWLGIFDLIWVGPIFALIWLICIIYAIVKYQLMDIKLAITRIGIFLVVGFIMLGIPVLLGYKYGIWKISTYMAVILATLGPFIYRWLKVRTDAIILKEEQTFQQYLQYLGREAVYVKSNDELSAVAAKSYNLEKKPYFDALALYLFDQKAGEYKLKVNQGQNYDFDQALASGDRLVKALIEKSGDGLLEEELKKQKLLKAAVILPLWQKQEEKLLGFLVLGAKHSNLAYTFNDLTALSNFAYQIMLGLTNIEFLETRRKEDAEFFRQEKLRSLGTLASMMGHQISNRLGAIQKEVERFAINPSFIQARQSLELNLGQWSEVRKAFLGIMKKLSGETKQANEIIEVLANYSRATDITFKPIDLAQVVLANPVEIVKVKHHKFFDKYPEILKFTLGKGLPLINGNQAMLGELLINLLSNAVDAVEERIEKQINLDKNYQPNISVKIKAGQNLSSVEVIIEDNGIGMTKEIQDKIFVPFFTTKSSSAKGTGWGLYVINMIVEKHQGSLKVESEYGKGTKFTLMFPCIT